MNRARVMQNKYNEALISVCREANFNFLDENENFFHSRECKVSSSSKYLSSREREREDVWWWTPLGIPSSFLGVLLGDIEEEDWV